MGKRRRRWQNVTTIDSLREKDIIRVFGITRVSSDKQAKKVGESLDHQKDVLNSWVTAKSTMLSPQKWTLAEIYVENENDKGERRGRTATTTFGREGLRKALLLSKSGLIDIVVVTKLDRIARNLLDYIQISAQFNESGVALVCLDLDIDTSTPDGQMIMRNHANLAQWQADRISQYSLETNVRHAQQGRPLGSPPIGYKMARDENGHHTFLIHPGFKKHVNLIDNLYIKYESSNKVAKELRRLGCRTPRGKFYTKPQTLRILQNIRYSSYQEYEGKRYPGKWKPIRDLKTYETIQSIIKTNSKTNHSTKTLHATRQYVYLLQGLLKCPVCQSSMVPKPGMGGSKVKRYYPYYLCLRADKTDGAECESVYVPAESVDNAVIQFLKKLKLEPKIIEKVITGANKSSYSRIKSINEDLIRVRSLKAKTDEKIQNLVEVLADKGIEGVETVRDRLHTLQTDMKDLSQEEQRLDQEVKAETKLAGSVREQIQTLQLFEMVVDSCEDNPDKLKSVLSSFIRYAVCKVYDRKTWTGEITVGLFCKPLIDSSLSEMWGDTLEEVAKRYGDNAKNLIFSQNGGRHQGRGRPPRQFKPTTGLIDPVRLRVSNGVANGN